MKTQSKFLGPVLMLGVMSLGELGCGFLVPDTGQAGAPCFNNGKCLEGLECLANDSICFLRATSIAASGRHTCALSSGGGVKCWGWNFWGELGDGTDTQRNTPWDVPGLTSGATSITAGEFHNCGLTSAGGVKCWGTNGYGQLGYGMTGIKIEPVDVTGLTSGVTSIAAGNSHTCALTSAGGIKCWGRNADGQLGDETKDDKKTPVDVTGMTSGIRSIAAGGSHTCSLTSTGGVKCWGANGNGQLGNGTTDYQKTPVDVTGLTSGVTSITAGGSHTCAVISAGGVKCWGANQVGQLGDGTKEDKKTPVDTVGYGP